MTLTSAFSLSFSIFFLGCSQQQAATPSQLLLLGQSCQAQMVASTCQAMKPTGKAMPAQGEVVFVAGVGPVDAQLLAKLSNAGETMCSEVKAVCAQDWHGKACVPLKKMYAPELAK
jgi:hypothetical protein